MENFKLNKPSLNIHHRERMVALILSPEQLQAIRELINYTQPKQLILDI